MRFQNLIWSDVLSHVFDLSVAFLLAMPIGWHTEKEARSAGIRTFPLVAVASCGLVLVAIRVLGEQSQSQARILEGIIAGVGFIGGGAILKTDVNVQGTAAAASIWNTGVVGAAVGFAFYDIAFVLALINFMTLRLLLPLKQQIAKGANGSTDSEQGGDKSQARKSS
jgi:putative Mg2+ transporter-C (MgtC) family protein